jgi:hypothetical protein
MNKKVIKNIVNEVVKSYGLNKTAIEKIKYIQEDHWDIAASDVVFLLSFDSGLDVKPVNCPYPNKNQKINHIKIFLTKDDTYHVSVFDGVYWHSCSEPSDNITLDMLKEHIEKIFKDFGVYTVEELMIKDIIE